MLQQTQASRVCEYFVRFVATFPDIFTLAAAPPDGVSEMWQGLGYYRRARFLHQCSKIIVSQHKGIVPDKPDILEQLPGIGRSTANAIVAQTYDLPFPILDANAIRVISRLYGVTQSIEISQVKKQLWDYAEGLTPQKSPALYTQGIMDLGTIGCTKTRPACHCCPIAQWCVARKNDLVHLIPVKKKPTKKIVSFFDFLLYKTEQEVLLERRPPAGIWPGLWCLPHLDPSQTEPYVLVQSIKHELSHRKLTIRIFEHASEPKINKVQDSQQRLVPIASLAEYGLPSPIQKVLSHLS